MKLRLLIIFVFLPALMFAQNDEYIRKIGAYKERYTIRDTAIVNKLVESAKDSAFSNSARSLKFAHQANMIASKLEYNDGRCRSYLSIATAKVYLNDFDSAHYYTDQCLKIAAKTGDKVNQIRGHELKGNIYTYQSNYKKATDELLKGVKIAEGFNKKLASSGYVNLALVFRYTNNPSKCEEYCHKSYKLGKKFKDTSVMIASLNLLGLTFKTDSTKALKYFREGLSYSISSRNLKRESEILYNMSNVYFDFKNPKKGFDLFNQSMELSRTNGSFQNIAIGFHSLSMNLFSIGELEKAVQASDSALKYSELADNVQLIMESYALKAQLALENHEYERSLHYLEKAYEYKDTLYLNQNSLDIAAAESKYLSEKEQMKNEMLREQEKKLADEQIWWREILLWISAFVLILLIVGATVLYRNNKKVKAKNILVESQKQEIELQHAEITDSIQYAKRIQTALISSEAWKYLSRDVSIFFRPKNVVSGDFYWVHHDSIRNISTWAVADCTGHGVPGAFMSMLGIGFLNEIVADAGITDPGRILDELRTKIVAALSNEQSESKDGMDIGICVWDRATDKIKFAGANNGMYLIRNNELMEYAPDKMPIGSYFKVPPPFSVTDIEVQPNDILVLFSDGFADQFGGPDDKKYKYKSMKDLLLELSKEPFKDHPVRLEEALLDWKGNREQTDDVCIVEVRIC